MSVKLNGLPHNHISPWSMVDGQIAEIVAWREDRYIGNIVQRCGIDLITVGEGVDKAWSGLFARLQDIACSVRVLKKGETLEVL